MFLIQKEVFNELYYEIFDGIDKLNKEIDYDNLNYVCKSGY